MTEIEPRALEGRETAWLIVTSSDWVTWVGHAIQGAVITLVGMLLGFTSQAMVGAVALVFAHRELDNMWEAWRHDVAHGRRVVDGFWDWLAPVASAVLVSWFLR